MNALEDLGEGFALLEIETAIVAGLAVSRSAIRLTHQIHIPIRHGPASPNRQRRIELPLNLANIEVDRVSRCSSAQRNGKGQCLGLEDSLPCCFCHEALLVGSKYAPP